MCGGEGGVGRGATGGWGTPSALRGWGRRVDDYSFWHAFGVETPRADVSTCGRWGYVGLFFEHEVDGEDEEDEGDDVVGSEGFGFEEEEGEGGEDGEGDDFLDDFELEE